MTQFHAGNLQDSIREAHEGFNQSVATGDWQSAERSWRTLSRLADTCIQEARNARIEVDALAAELLVYRPVRSGRPPAPQIAGYVYVFTAKFPWVCAAVELHKKVLVRGIGSDYLQDHYVPERKTVCGKVTAFPVTERFESGGWPRMHELCPECTKELIVKGLIFIK